MPRWSSLPPWRTRTPCCGSRWAQALTLPSLHTSRQQRPSGCVRSDRLTISSRVYWTEERWIRVTDDEKNLKWVGLNRPITVGEKLEGELGPVPPEMANDPRLGQVVDMENAVAELDVDIILEDAPDSVTLQMEQFEMLAQMYQANPQAIPFDMIIEASQLRNKAQILERMKGGSPEEQQQRQQQEQEQAELQKAGIVSEIEQNNAKAQRDAAAAAKASAEADATALETAVQMQLLNGGRL